MSKKQLFIYLGFYLVTIVFTCYGILQLSSSGGPCNAGIAFIILIPVLLICSLLLARAIYLIYNFGKSYSKSPKILTSISLIIWSYWSFQFLSDGTTEYGFFYLGLFEVLNIWTLMIAIPSPS